jgi:hypothetical protein
VRQAAGIAWIFANEGATRGNRDDAIALMLANGIVGKQDAIALIDDALAFKNNGGTDDNFILKQKFVLKYDHACMEQAGLTPEDAAAADPRTSPPGLR